MKTLILLTFMVWGSVGPVAWAGVVEEYQVKAAYFYHFSRFIEWPEEKFSSDHDPFLVCMVGDNPFQGELKKILDGKKVQDHPFSLIQNPSKAELVRCHVVFVGQVPGDRSKEVPYGFQGLGVLTIGESSDFIRKGGIIRLFLEDNKVRFGINPEAAQKARLEISSKLLRLAKIENP